MNRRSTIDNRQPAIDRALLRAAGVAASVVFGKERYRTTLPYKVGNLRSAFVELLNYLSYLSRSERSHGFTSLSVELMNKCNIRCLQCPVNRAMKRPRAKMDQALFEKILDSSPHLWRVHLTGWGEPLLHEGIYDTIRAARSRSLAVTLFTNATLLDETASHGLLDAGVRIVSFSLDGVGETFEKVRGVKYEKVRANILRFLELRRERGGGGPPPLVEVNVVLFDATKDAEAEVRREWEDKVDLLTTQPLALSEGNRRRKRCLHLWRRMTVLADGRVVPCCVDVEGDLVLGDANEEGMAEIFNGPAMRRLRRDHLEGRFPGLCAACDEFYG